MDFVLAGHVQKQAQSSLEKDNAASSLNQDAAKLEHSSGVAGWIPAREEEHQISGSSFHGLLILQINIPFSHKDVQNSTNKREFSNWQVERMLISEFIIR